MFKIRISLKSSLHLSNGFLGRRDLQDILDERWYSEIICLPRVMSSASNDELKFAKLLSIKGYLQFYGDGLKYLLCTTSYLDKFLYALIQVIFFF